jgi:hypothetical protein
MIMSAPRSRMVSDTFKVSDTTCEMLVGYGRLVIRQTFSRSWFTSHTFPNPEVMQSPAVPSPLTEDSIRACIDLAEWDSGHGDPDASVAYGDAAARAARSR